MPARGGGGLECRDGFGAFEREVLEVPGLDVKMEFWQGQNLGSSWGLFAGCGCGAVSQGEKEPEFPVWDGGSWGIRISSEGAAPGPSVLVLGMEMRHRAPVMLFLPRVVSLAL